MDHIDSIFQAGFFGTRAPLFMDVVTSIVAILPFLVGGAILLAMKKHHKLHGYAQMLIFAVSVIVLGYFEYGVRISGGFNAFMEESSVSYNYALIVLLVHIAIAVLTLIVWTSTMVRDAKKMGVKKHKRLGYITFSGIILISLTGIWVYFLMFVY